jgi:hypothetical protein
MSVRSSMADLITRVRLLINDPSGGSQVFTDQQVQDALDTYRTDVRYMALREQPTYQASPLTTAWLDYYDDGRGFWESDAVLNSAAWATLSPATSDYLTGHWTFSSSTNPPVYITGKSYDVYLAAADLAETWASNYARAYDFSADGGTFNRSQMQAGLRALAVSLRSRAKPRSVRMVRGDVYSGGR